MQNILVLLLPEEILTISLTMASWASWYSVLFLVYSSLREVNALQIKVMVLFKNMRTTTASNGHYISSENNLILWYYWRLNNMIQAYKPIGKFNTILLDIYGTEVFVVTKDFFFFTRYAEIISKLWIWIQFNLFARFQTFM